MGRYHIVLPLWTILGITLSASLCTTILGFRSMSTWYLDRSGWPGAAAWFHVWDPVGPCGTLWDPVGPRSTRILFIDIHRSHSTVQPGSAWFSLVQPPVRAPAPCHSSAECLRSYLSMLHDVGRHKQQLYSLYSLY